MSDSRPPNTLTKAKMEVLMTQQGDEIRRLADALQAAEDAKKSLQNEVDALKVAHEDVLRGLARVPQRANGAPHPPITLKKKEMEEMMHQQADTLRRLLEVVKASEARNRELEDEIEALKIAHADITGRLKHAQAAIAAHNLAPTTKVKARAERTPLYKKQPIAPFYTGDTVPAALVLKAATALAGKGKRKGARRAPKPALAHLGPDTLFSASYNTCTLLRADATRSPSGSWAPTTHPNLTPGTVLHALVSLDGRAFYAGAFQVATRSRASPDAFGRLAPEGREALVRRVDADAGRRAESAREIREGRVGLTRVVLRRVGYEQRFQAALLKCAARRGEAKGEDGEQFVGVEA